MKKILSYARRKVGIKSNRGFTIAEVLIVVAILAILFGFGFAAGNEVIKGTRQRNMDKRAEVIYYAAESRMMELFVTKTEQELETSGIKGAPTTTVDGTTVSYVTSAGPDTAKTVLRADKSLDAELGEGSKWVIEYDPISLDVYSVIISEQSSNYSLSQIYSGGTAADGVRGSASDRKSAFNAQVGYYCAGAGTTAALLEGSENGFLAGAWILNKRELLGVVKIAITQDTYNEIGTSDISYKISIKGVTSGATYEIPAATIKWKDLNGNETTSTDGTLSRSAFGAGMDSGTYSLTGSIILDSLKTVAEDPNASQFKDLVAGSGIIPGEDITLTVTISDIAGENGAAKVRGIEAVSTEENSLFATGSAMNASLADAYIEYPRHLQNLAEGYSGCNNIGGLLSNIKATVKSDIKWDETENLVSGAAREFKPITNTSGKATIISFDGIMENVSPADCYAIEGIKVLPTEADGGLFGTQAGGTISNIKLVNFDIATTGSAGALAGTLTGTTKVSNVIAYNETGADSAIQITGGTSAGGLIGSVTGGEVTGCAAALYVASSGDCGGLIGTATGSVINDSYAGGHTINNGIYSDEATGAGRINVQGTNAGGLVGSSSSTISNSYSTCSAAGSATTGGLVGAASGGTINNCYAVGSVKNGTGAGALCGSSSASFSGNNYYLSIVNEKYDTTDGFTYPKGVGGATENPAGVTAIDEDDEEDGGQTAVEKYNSFMRSQYEMTAITSKDVKGYAEPYDTALGHRYEIKTVKDLFGSSTGLFASTHYGDWPVPENIIYNDAHLASLGRDAIESDRGIFAALRVRAESLDEGIDADLIAEDPLNGAVSEMEAEAPALGADDGAAADPAPIASESVQNTGTEEAAGEAVENAEEASGDNSAEEAPADNEAGDGGSEEAAEPAQEEPAAEDTGSEESSPEESAAPAESTENSGESGSEGSDTGEVQEDAGTPEDSSASQENPEESTEAATTPEGESGEGSAPGTEDVAGETGTGAGDAAGENGAEAAPAENGTGAETGATEGNPEGQTPDGTTPEEQVNPDGTPVDGAVESPEDTEALDGEVKEEEELVPEKEVTEEKEETIIEGEMLSDEELVKIVFGKDAKIPEGAEVVVREITIEDEEYNGYVTDATDALNVGTEQVASYKVLDIKIMKDGEEIQPESTVNVEIDTEKLYENEEVFSDDDISAVHIKEDEEAEVLTTELTNNEGETAKTDEITSSTEAATSFSFETDGFSVYVFVQLIKEKIVAASDNNTYEVTVTYDNVSGIPAGSELIVEEISSETDEFKDYIEESAEKLEASSDEFWFAHAFDIYFLNPETGEHYQPTKEVSVSIKLMQEDVNEEREMSIVHFGDDTEVVDCAVENDAVTFSADGFSVYVVVGHEGDDEVATPHVEFHFLSEEYTVLTGGKQRAGSYSFVNKAGTYQTSEIIKNGESLEAIKNPPNKFIDDGTGTGNTVEQYFYGWYVVNYDSTDGNGNTTYSWSEDPEQVVFGRAATITPPTNGRVGENVTWNINGVSGTGPLDRNGCAHVYLAPIYEDYYFVNFHMGAKEDTTLRSSLLERKMVVLGSDEKVTVRIGNISATSTDSTHKVFAGWETVTDTTTYNTKDIYFSVDASTGIENNSPGSTTGYFVTFNKSDFNDENIDLYPVFAEARWINFNTGKSGNNAKYIGAQYLLTSDEDDRYFLSALPDNTQAVRAGFDFQGWYADAYLDADGNIANLNSSYTVSDGQGGTITYPQATKISNADGSLNNYTKYDTDGTTVLYKIENGKLHLYKALDSLTLYAHWQEYDDTTFTVIIWKQKITDSKDAADADKTYDYEDSFLNIPASSSYTLANLNLTTYKSYNYTGFHYAKADMSSAKVSGDGTTVVNVYYDRDLMTIILNNRTYNVPGAGTIDIPNVTYDNNGTQYGYANGQFRVLTRGAASQGTVWYFRYVYTAYNYGNYRLYKATRSYVNSNNVSGNRYSRGNGNLNNNPYGGTRYTRGGNNYQNYTYSATNSTSGTLYGLDSNGGYAELTSTTGTIYQWSYTDDDGNPVAYEGVRYKFTNGTGIKWTGLYGQTFEQNGYSWDTVSGYIWNEQADGNGTTQTMLYGFIQEDNPYNLYCQGNSGNNYIYHYRQQLDGTYTESDKTAARTNNSTSNFNFTNKFDGFQVAAYSTNQEGFRTGGGTHSVSVGDSESLYTPFYVYHTRNSYKLTLNVNYPNDVNISYSNGRSENKEYTVLFGKPLTDYSSTGNSYFVPKTPDNYTFEGWYEDETGTTPFNFTSTMPAANKVIYAKWSPVKYRVQVDPNGGEIDHIDHTRFSHGGYHDYPGISPFRYDNSGYNRSQSTYINAEYGTAISEYDIHRNFVPISDAAAAEYTGTIYYYINTQYRETDGSGLPSDLRNALYITEAEIDEYYDFYHDWTQGNIDGGYITGTTLLGREAWKQLYVSSQKYRAKYPGENYQFLGWYKLDSNGNPEAMPYDFSQPVSAPFTIRAYWRLDGGYNVEYIPEFTANSGGSTALINGNLIQWRDPGVNESNYADGAATNILQQPTGLTVNGAASDEYIFRGWRLVSRSTDGTGNTVYTPLENDVYYDPGDPFTIRADYADSTGTIYMQAYYEERDSSYRRPHIANLTLDANTGFITLDGTNELDTNTDITGTWSGNIGKISATVTTDTGDVELIEFGDIQSNEEVHLYRYATNLTEDYKGNALTDAKNYFKNPNNYFLLGFDDASDEGDYVATYPADAIIAVQRTDNKTIYAVWEPLVYLNFKNEAVGDVTFGLSSNDSSALQIINIKNGVYDRTPLTNINNITVHAGETLKLAIPYGEGKRITIKGTNTLGAGTTLLWDSDASSNPSHGYAENSETFEFAETPIVDATGITVTFTSKQHDRTIVLHDNYGDDDTRELYFEYSETECELPQTSTRLGYQFAGWALNPNAQSADYSSANDFKIANLNTFFGSDNVKDLYAVWIAKAEAQTVYVYKSVPKPGDKTKSFNFSVSFSGSCKNKAGNYTYDISTTPRTESLTDGQYIKIFTVKYVGRDRVISIFNPVSAESAYVRSTITKYDSDGTQIGSEHTISWTNGTPGEMNFYSGGLTFKVEETDYSNSFYDTSIEVAAETPDDAFTTTERITTWGDSDAGGTLIYTNTRQAKDVKVKKVVETNTTIGSNFNFTASYKLDGITTQLDDFSVFTGGEHTLEKIPVGAELTISETEYYNYKTEVSASAEAVAIDNGTYDKNTRTYKFTVPNKNDIEVVYKNSLKDYKVTMYKVDQNLNPGIEAFFRLALDANVLENLLYPNQTTGIFYTAPRTVNNQEIKFYVGQYTLTETWVQSGYMQLEDDIVLTLTGETDEHGKDGKLISNDRTHVRIVTEDVDNDDVNEFKVYIINSNGAEVFFNKVDSYGNLLGNTGTSTEAWFAVYENYDDALNASVTDAKAGTTFNENDANLETITITTGEGATAVKEQRVYATQDENGQVKFEIPSGIHYMREVKTPDQYVYDSSEYIDYGTITPGTDPTPCIYRLVVGTDAAATVGITLPADKEFVIQRMQDDTTVDDTLDVEKFGIMNISKDRRRVILTKENLGTNIPLQGAMFDIIRPDRSFFAKDRTSGAGGAFYIGDLPLGIYYIHEKVAPLGSASQGTYYKLTINVDGKTLESVSSLPTEIATP